MRDLESTRLVRPLQQCRRRAALLEVLDNFQAEGKTAIIVHHNLGDVRALFDRAVLIDGGVTAVGTPDTVLASPAFTAAFGALEPRAA